jgi:hypothetical protein
MVKSLKPARKKPQSSSRPKDVLIVMAKRPAAGQTKTRLAPPLTSGQAASLYECFLKDTLELIRQVPNVQPVIAYLPASQRAYFAQLADGCDLILQEGLDLGARLDQALTHYLQPGCRSAVIMDSDSPTLPVSCLLAAFQQLAAGAEVVLGPCDDGGYYLIGMKRPFPRLLREVRMSTPSVTADTLALAAEAGVQVGRLPTWYDVDDRPSLERLVSELAQASTGTARHTRLFLQEQGLLASLTQAPAGEQPDVSNGEKVGDL